MKKVAMLALVAAVVGLMATVAKADPVDPTVTINRGGGSPTTTSGSSQSDPIIVEAMTGTSDFLYMGPATNILFIEVIPLGEDTASFLDLLWTCDPGIATACFTVSPTQLPAVEFAFLGAQGQTLFTPGMDIQVSVPEPSALLLLFVGLACVAGLAIKQRKPILA